MHNALLNFKVCLTINKFRCLFLGEAKRIEMAAQEKDARKENMNNMRKNRAYQELKREMDQKRRAREKVRLFLR
jgi:ATP-dependent protease ClpP protease subunit